MILAAGEGTRLRPLTLNRPKPMLPVGGQAIMEYTIAWLRHYGVTQIAINLYHQPQIVKDHFGDGSAFGVQIFYSVENTILGTAGGVKRVVHFFEDDPFVVIYGDVLTDLDLGALVDFHDSRPSGHHLSLCLYRVSNPWECGIVSLDGRGRITRFVEKPSGEDVFSNLASAGVIVIDPEILEHVPDGFYDFGRDLFPRLLNIGVPMYGWLLPDGAYLIDIGTPEKYERVQREWPTKRACLFMEREK